MCRALRAAPSMFSTHWRWVLKEEEEEGKGDSRSEQQ